MTRNECLDAVSAAFGRVRVHATTHSWSIRIETVPPCNVVLMPSFINTHIDCDGMSPDELTQKIANAPADAWAIVEQPFKTLVLAETAA
jgi:hypothetical protein